MICFQSFFFYEELNIRKADHTFKEYAMSYKVEIVKKKDPLIQLEVKQVNQALKTCLVIF